MIRKVLALAAVAALLASPALAINASYVNTPLDTPQAMVNSAITNVNTALAPQGTGTVSSGIQVNSTASAVNALAITPGATGTGVTIANGGAGSDANANINVKGSGTGIVALGQTICTASGATPQTCNGQRGIATTNSLSTAAATDASYVINNSSVTSSSLVACTLNGYSGTFSTNGNPVIEACTPGSGTITVQFRNVNAANALSGTLALGFVVLN